MISFRPLISFVFPFLIVITFSCAPETELTAPEILSKSIAFHDPVGQWEYLDVKMYFEEINPKEEIRNTTAWLNMKQGYFKLNRGDIEVHGMVKDSCFVEKGDVDCARAARMRDYYIYLWGLPMKLMDPGTELLDSVGKSNWEGRDVYVLYVDYEKDDWKYYIDKENFQMLGYEFVQTTGNSEKILLEGLTSYENMKFPAIRSWYMISDNDRFLGTDKLLLVEDAWR